MRETLTRALGLSFCGCWFNGVPDAGALGAEHGLTPCSYCAWDGLCCVLCSWGYLMEVTFLFFFPSPNPAHPSFVVSVCGQVFPYASVCDYFTRYFIG